MARCTVRVETLPARVDIRGQQVFFSLASSASTARTNPRIGPRPWRTAQSLAAMLMALVYEAV